MARRLARSHCAFLATFLMTALGPAASAQHAHHGDDGDDGGHGHAMHANQYMNQRSFEELAARFESAERDAWQHPDAVMARLGDVAGKQVMDIGSGTGYFSFRLAAAGARVICGDVDERFLDYIRERRAREGIAPERMELRHLAMDSPGLAAGEVDLVLLVDTYHHIEDREAYFAAVRAGLAPGGRLVVIDFFKRDDPQGPPVRMKVAEDQVVAELARAGFSRFTIERGLLPYQYLVEAWP
ncbi:MAG: class I SAM-dependent methyltransferase [Gammaproteobacteria bacterium]|nr:class I SAM-dependent methyltransferase [Gammaproteobacteria bacterium]